MTPLLRVDDLVKHFPVRQGPVRPRAAARCARSTASSFDVAVGETLALVGESGCGKSTTGRLVLRLLEPTSGRVDVRRRGPVRAARARDARAPARDADHLPGPVRVAQPAHDGRPDARRAARAARARRRPAHASACARSCDLVGLAARVRAPLPARVLGRPAPAHRHRARARGRAAAHRLRRAGLGARRLDPGAGRQPAASTCSARFGLSYVFIAHDLAVVKFIATRIAVMYLGRIVELADKRALFARAAPPVHAGAARRRSRCPHPALKRRRIVLAGDVPSPSDPPSGCRFRTRCPHARAALRRRDAAARAGRRRPRGRLPLLARDRAARGDPARHARRSRPTRASKRCRRRSARVVTGV